MNAHIYLLLTIGFYSVGMLHVLVHVLTRRRLLTNWTVTATFLGFAVHTAALAVRAHEAGHFPVVGAHDGASFIAWGIVLAFLVTHLRTRVDALGLAVYPAAFALVLVANLTPVSARTDPGLKTFFLPLHTTLAVVGYGALFVSCAMSLLYLVQEREIKSRNPRRFYYLIPSLEKCDSVSGESVSIGFAFLTLAIVTGLLWSQSAHGRYWTGDGKEWAAVVAWLIYVALLWARHRSGWGGRRAAFLSIAGFAAVAFAFVWVALHPSQP